MAMFALVGSELAHDLQHAAKGLKGVPQLTVLASLAHLCTYTKVSLDDSTFECLFGCLRKALLVGLLFQVLQEPIVYCILRCCAESVMVHCTVIRHHDQVLASVYCCSLCCCCGLVMCRSWKINK